MKTVTKITTILLIACCGASQAAGEKLDVSDPDQAMLASNKLFCDNAPDDVDGPIDDLGGLVFGECVDPCIGDLFEVVR